MPIQNGKYISPTWSNENPPAIEASELQALTDTVENTYTKQEVISDATKVKFDLSAVQNNNDAMNLLSRFQAGLGNEYLWERIKNLSTFTLGGISKGKISIKSTKSETTNVPYSSEIYIDNKNVARLKNPQFISMSYDNAPSYESFLRGKYYIDAKPYNTVKYFRQDSTLRLYEESYKFVVEADGNLIIGAYKADVDYINSQASSTPPIISGFEYYRLGMFGEKLNIDIVEYTGNGLYGSGDRTGVVFKFFPKIVFITPKNGGRLGVFIDGTNDMFDPYKTNSQAVGYIADNHCIWWAQYNSNDQFNVSGTDYLAIAIG